MLVNLAQDRVPAELLNSEDLKIKWRYCIGLGIWIVEREIRSSLINNEFQVSLTMAVTDWKDSVDSIYYLSKRISISAYIVNNKRHCVIIFKNLDVLVIRLRFNGGLLPISPSDTAGFSPQTSSPFLPVYPAPSFPSFPSSQSELCVTEFLLRE